MHVAAGLRPAVEGWRLEFRGSLGKSHASVVVVGLFPPGGTPAAMSAVDP
jgi:hypothetical protein